MARADQNALAKGTPIATRVRCFGSWYKKVAWSASVLTPLALLMSSPLAHAAPFTLGAFGMYGLLVSDGASGGDINTPPVNANIGIGDVRVRLRIVHWWGSRRSRRLPMATWIIACETSSRTS